MGILDGFKDKQKLAEKNEEQAKLIASQEEKIKEQEEKIKFLEKVQLNVQNKVYTTAELEKTVSEKERFKNLEAFHDQLQKNFEIIRKLDNLFERKGGNKQNSKHEINNVVFSMLQLRSLLNLAYCSVSKKDMKPQIDNLRDLNIDKDKEIYDLISSLSEELMIDDELLFQIENGNYYNALSLYQKVHKLFNKDMNKFPDDYQFGIEEDKHF